MAKRYVKIFLGILVLLVLSLPSVALCQAWTKDFKAYIYWKKTGDSVVVAWDAVPDALSYEFYLSHMETGMRYATGKTSTPQVSVTLTKVGHYLVYARSVGVGEANFSAWVTSLTAGMVDGVVQPWAIYARIAAPTGSSIGN